MTTTASSPLSPPAATGDAPTTARRQPLVEIVMGSRSDLEVMRAAHEVLTDLGVDADLRVVSAHRDRKSVV